MSRNCTTADAYIRIAHTAGGSIATTQDTPVPDVCICFVRLVSICIVLHIHSIPVPVRIPEIRIPGTLLRHVRIVELSTNRPKRITADARSQPARTVKGNTAIIQGTCALNVRIFPAELAECCIVPSTRHITAPDRIRISNGQGKPLSAHTAGRPTRKVKTIPADALSRTVLTVERNTAIIPDTPVPLALTKRASTVMLCTA